MTKGTSIGRAFAINLVVISSIFISLASWAIASPVGASPDEDHHLVSIWCAGSGVEEMCEEGSDAGSRRVSESLLSTACFAHAPSTSAKCQEQSGVFEKTDLTESRRGNFSGNYPDGFYVVMSLFASENIEISVIMMRLFNVLLFTTIFSAIWLKTSNALRRSLHFTVLLTFVPLGLFLVPSINPSSWAIMGVIATFFGAVSALQSTNKNTAIFFWCVTFAGLLIASMSRYDGFVYSLIGLVAGFFIAKRFSLSKKIIKISLTSATVLMISFILFGGSSIITRLTGLAGTSGESSDADGLGVLVRNLLDFPMFVAGFSGSMAIGWLDTLMPYASWMIASVILWAVLFLRLGQIRGSQLAISLAIAALVVFIPLVVLQTKLASVGENVQSRYIYPLFLVFVGSMLFANRTNTIRLTTVQQLFIALGVGFAQSISLFVNLTRYISGSGTGGFSPNLDQASIDGWWWQHGPSPMFVFLLGSVTFFAFASSIMFIPKHAEMSHEIMKTNAS